MCSTTTPAHGPKHTAPSRRSVTDEVSTCEDVGRDEEEEEEGQDAEEGEEEGDIEEEEEETELEMAAQVVGPVLVTVPPVGMGTTQRTHGHDSTERSFSWDH